MSYGGPRGFGYYGFLEDSWNKQSGHTKYILKTGASSLPFIGPIIQAYDNIRYMDDYTRNRGIDYDDILYPTRTDGAQGLGSAVSFVSNNITKLYKEDVRAKRRVSSNRRRYRTYY